MMNRPGIRIAIAICALFSVAEVAQAQVGTSRSRYTRPPTLSPYLGLLRINTGVLPNYQTFVRPRLQERQAFEQQQRSLQTLETRVRQVAEELPATGIASRFRNNGLYFRNNAQFFQTHKTRR